MAEGPAPHADSESMPGEQGQRRRIDTTAVARPLVRRTEAARVAPRADLQGRHPAAESLARRVVGRGARHEVHGEEVIVAIEEPRRPFRRRPQPKPHGRRRRRAVGKRTGAVVADTAATIDQGTEPVSRRIDRKIQVAAPVRPRPEQGLERPRRDDRVWCVGCVPISPAAAGRLLRDQMVHGAPRDPIQRRNRVSVDHVEDGEGRRRMVVEMLGQGRPEAPPLTLFAQQKRDAAIECPCQLRGIGAAGSEGRDRQP